MAQNGCKSNFTIINTTDQQLTVEAYTSDIYEGYTVFSIELADDTLVNFSKTFDTALCSACNPYCVIVLRVSTPEWTFVQVVPWKPYVKLTADISHVLSGDSVAISYSDTFLNRRYQEMVRAEKLFADVDNEDSMVVLADEVMKYLYKHYSNEPLINFFALSFWELGILNSWWISLLCSGESSDDPAHKILCSAEKFSWQLNEESNIAKVNVQELKPGKPVIIYSAKNILRLNDIMKDLEQRPIVDILNLTFICTEPNYKFCNFYVPSKLKDKIDVIWDSAGVYVKEIFNVSSDTLIAGFVYKEPALMFVLKDTEVTVQHILKWTDKPTNSLCVNNEVLNLCLLTKSIRASTNYKCGVFPYIEVKEKQIIDGILRVDNTRLSCLTASMKGEPLTEYLKNADWFSYWKYVSEIDCEKEKENVKETKRCVNSP